MNKKISNKMITAVLLAASLVTPISLPSYANYTDMNASSAEAQAAERLNAYGVMYGRTEKVFSPDTYLTRADLAGIAVRAYGETELQTGARFSDVSTLHYANGEIGAASNLGLLTGYPDGSFKPETYVTYAEAVTVTLRLLGYDTSVISGTWPESYMRKADTLGLTASIAQAYDAPISRGNMAVLLDRAMVTPVYSEMLVGADLFLMEDKLNLDYIKNVIVDGSKANTPSILDGEVLLSGRTYFSVINPDEIVSKRGDAVLNSDDELIAFITSEQDAESYYLITATEDYVRLSRTETLYDSQSEKILLDNQARIYFKGSDYLYEDIYEELDSHMPVTLYRTESGSIDYLFVIPIK